LGRYYRCAAALDGFLGVAEICTSPGHPVKTVKYRNEVKDDNRKETDAVLPKISNEKPWHWLPSSTISSQEPGHPSRPPETLEARVGRLLPKLFRKKEVVEKYTYINPVGLLSPMSKFIQERQRSAKDRRLNPVQ
jgi:hypothetical protein